MAADIKSLRLRIKSVDSTLHLTKAMGLVASSKIRRATEKMTLSGSFNKEVDSVLAALTSCRECKNSIYSQKRETGKDTVIVIAGDRGLAGGYNANVFRLMREVKCDEVIAIGKRALDRYPGGYPTSEKFTDTQAYDLAKDLLSRYVSGEIKTIRIVSTKYRSVMTQIAVCEDLLPITVDETKKETSVLFEPSAEEVLEDVVLSYLGAKISACVRESFACEVAARRSAMDSAGKNAQEMITNLQLKYNRARQGAITQEITEIVAGSGSED